MIASFFRLREYPKIIKIHNKKVSDSVSNLGNLELTQMDVNY
jgi:hypothetical protein